MKWKTLIGMAVASAFASTGAFAGPFNHGTEVQTPTSVNESAPWLALEESGYSAPSRIHHDEVAISDSAFGTGASSTESASGVIGFDSSATENAETVDYWRLDQSSDAGSTTGYGEGSGSFSSAVSSSEFADELAMGESSGDEYALFSESGDELADATSLDEPVHIGSVTTYYGDNLALLLDTGIDSGESEA